jgi:hypothetical protein
MASVESAKVSIWQDRRQMDAPGAKSDAIPTIRASRGGGIERGRGGRDAGGDAYRDAGGDVHGGGSGESTGPWREAAL